MKVSDLRGILQYVPRFREKIFVVAVDGEIVASPNFANILLDLAVLRSLSIKVILVHGAGAQIAQLAAERVVKISNHDGTGVTDDATLKISVEAATNVLSEIMQGLTSVDLRAAYANAIIAHPAGILGGVDYLNTGRVERVVTKSLHLFLNEGIIPLIPPMGFDGEGNTYRVNSDGIALEVAETMQAMKVIFLSASEGLVLNSEFIRQLSIHEAEEIVKKKIPENSKEIGVARSYGDLRENFEFKAAKQMQAVLARRRAELEIMLSQARGTSFENPDTAQVSIGTVVTLRDTAAGEEETYTILGAWDGNPDERIISYQTAIGQALLGRKVGEQVSLNTESGSGTFEITKIAPAPVDVLPPESAVEEASAQPAEAVAS